MYLDLPIRHEKKFVSLHFFYALHFFRHQLLKQHLCVNLLSGIKIISITQSMKINYDMIIKIMIR